MILNYKTFSKQNLGNSFLFSTQGGRGKEKNQKPATKKSVRPSKGMAEGPPSLKLWTGERGVGRPEAEQQARCGINSAETVSFFQKSAREVYNYCAQVPGEGLEPSILAERAPKAREFANFSIPAYIK